MTTIHKDDVTGEEYTHNQDMIEFGIAQDDLTMASFDAHLRTLHDNPEAIAEHLHESVDEWLEQTRRELNE